MSATDSGRRIVKQQLLQDRQPLSTGVFCSAGPSSCVSLLRNVRDHCRPARQTAVRPPANRMPQERWEEQNAGAALCSTSFGGLRINTFLQRLVLEGRGVCSTPFGGLRINTADIATCFETATYDALFHAPCQVTGIWRCLEHAEPCRPGTLMLSVPEIAEFFVESWTRCRWRST